MCTESIIYFWWECKMARLLWKTFWQFLMTLHLYFFYDLIIVILKLSVHTKKNENIYSHQDFHTNVHSSSAHYSLNLKVVQLSTNSATIYGSLSTKRRSRLPLYTTWMNLNNIMLSKRTLQKRVCTVRIHLHETLVKAKVIHNDKK